MTCKLIQELILTDYSDGELSPAKKRQVDNHLMHCLDCRLLAEKMRQETREPFSEAISPKVDSFVWARIKRQIKEQGKAPRAGASWEEILQGLTPSFRPMLAMATVVVLIGISAATLHISQVNRQAANVVGDERVGYIASLMASPVVEQENDLGTELETYFL